MFICLLPFRFSYFDILAKVVQFASLPIVWMGDCNAVLDMVLDSSNLNRMGNSDLVSWANVAGVSEL